MRLSLRPIASYLFLCGLAWNLVEVIPSTHLTLVVQVNFLNETNLDKLGRWNPAVAPLRSRGTTQRSRTRPLGRTDYPSVRLGNLLCCRALLLVILAASKGCMWVLEQPGSSTMEWHPLFQKMMKMIEVRKMFISMCNFGGPTRKPTLLYTGT